MLISARKVVGVVVVVVELLMKTVEVVEEEEPLMKASEEVGVEVPLMETSEVVGVGVEEGSDKEVEKE